MPEDIHWQKYSARFKTYPQLLPRCEVAPGMIVCIPVYAEKELIATLESLWNCSFPEVLIEVILLFNGLQNMSEEESALHTYMWEECLRWIERHKKDTLMLNPIYLQEQPDPKGGVGWARKLVLDEAARRMDQNGVMVCLDGDCIVAPNYLFEVYTYFQNHPGCDAASIYFEHDLMTQDGRAREAIAQYELHLRYLVAALRWVGHPFAFHTIGSSMAVRRGAYLAQGGMNTRQAGEDFYFLQKFIEIGKLCEINNTVVYPSPRISGRVPFGTGRAMQALLSSDEEWKTTDFQVFQLIKPLLSGVDIIRKSCAQVEGPNIAFEILGLHPWVINFLHHIEFSAQCMQIAAHTTTSGAFRRRFFRYFNSFMMIRYMHYLREYYLPDIPVSAAAIELLTEVKWKGNHFPDCIQLLNTFRHHDKENLSL